MTPIRSLFLLLLLLGLGCKSPEMNHDSAMELNSTIKGEFGVLVMAHGGAAQWNRGVIAAVKPLVDKYPIEIAFGMADAVSLQKAVTKLEARGAKRIGVVRLFVSGESWFERTEKILGIKSGAPARPKMEKMHKAGHSGHSMEFWRAQTTAAYALSTQGLSEAETMGAIIVDRAKALSKNAKQEDVLILAHGPADDAENQRWLVNITARAKELRDLNMFRRVQVMTLREDWPKKREEATGNIRNFVKRASDEGGKAIVVPYRVHGFGPYAKVLEGLDYSSDGRGLIPHSSVTQWLADQIQSLQGATYKAQVKHVTSRPKSH